MKTKYYFDKKLYFTYDPSKNINKCKVDGCGITLSGNVNFNMKRHIYTRHRSLANKLHLTLGNTVPTKCVDKSPGTQIVYNKNLVIKACVSLCTTKNLPFSIFDIDEMKYLIGPTLDKHKVQVTGKHIEGMVDQAAVLIKDLIKQQIKNRVVCIKVDALSLGTRKIIAVNCQYVFKGELVIRNLAMLEIKDDQPIDLKKKITHIILEFEISTTQISCLITDNGANIYNADELIEEAQEDLYFVKYHEDVDITRLSLFDEFIHQELSEIFTPIRCLAQVFQMCVLDFIRLEEHQNEFDRIRSALTIDEKDADVPTRWSSTYNMIDELVSNESAYMEENIELDIDWDFAKMFIEAFKPMFLLAKRLQDENMIISDLYKVFLELEMNIKNLPATNTFKTSLLEVVFKRKSSMFDNDIFLAGLFLDPRFNFHGSKHFPIEKVQPTMANLNSLWRAIKCFKTEPIVNIKSELTDQLEEQSQPQTMIMDLDSYIENLDSSFASSSSSPKQECSSIDEKLRGMVFQPRLHSSINVLEYWNDKQYAEPELFYLAEAVYSPAATQVSVGKIFSALTTILNKNRLELNETSLINNLMVRLNSDLLHSVNFE